MIHIKDGKKEKSWCGKEGVELVDYFGATCPTCIQLLEENWSEEYDGNDPIYEGRKE